MLTNKENPFKRGEVIEFADDLYEVVENFGDRGNVRAMCLGNTWVTSLKWEFEGEECRRVKSNEVFKLVSVLAQYKDKKVVCDEAKAS